MKEKELKQTILKSVKDYYFLRHAKKTFIPGQTKIGYAGRVFDERELINLVDSSLDFWLTAGAYAKKLEEELRAYFSAKKFYLVNSGSSANLIMVSALKAAQFEESLNPGDEVITPAVTFPTTLTPIVQNQLMPVFVDCEIDTYNIDPNKIEDAVSAKTRAIFIPHTLGNPCNMEIISEIAKRKNIFLIEDACDALGAAYDGKLVGTFGQMASLSFYPAHHITMGEGGGVIVNDHRFARIALSLRDWGRDCWCEPGSNDTCGKRFEDKHGDLPYGYDHKYVYSNIGYNLKATDLQASIGLAQFEKLPDFIKKRRENFDYFYKQLSIFEDKFILPRWEKKANPSWFGFPITVKEGVDSAELIRFLEQGGIETRKVFAGNVLRQPGFKSIRHRVYGDLKNSDHIMEKTFFIGVYPGLTMEMKEYVVERFNGFFKTRGGAIGLAGRGYLNG